jgi:hypothetical protein
MWGQHWVGVDGNLNSPESFYCEVPKRRQIGSEVKHAGGQDTPVFDHLTRLPTSILCALF